MGGLRGSSRLAHTVDEHTRALLETAGDSESYLERALSKNHRANSVRRYRRFQEAGRLTLRELSDATQLDHWIGEFLRLEASGWKGRNRGPSPSTAPVASSFQKWRPARSWRNDSNCSVFFVDDRPVALKCNLRAANGGFAFKIAYDEEFSKYSPGVQLEVANIDRLHEAEPDGVPPRAGGPPPAGWTAARSPTIP